MTEEESEKTEEIGVERIHCPDCAVKIEKNVSKIDGVGEATVDSGRGKLRVSYDPSKVKRTGLEKSISKIGYRVNHEDQNEGFNWIEPETILTALAGILLGGGLATSVLLPSLTLDFLPVKTTKISEILFLSAVVSGGYYVGRRGAGAIRNLSFDIDFLMTLAMLGAVAIGETMEAATLAFLYPLAEILEDWASERAKGSLKKLMDLSPKQVTVKRNGGETTVAAEEVKESEVLVVRPGEKIGLDGKVIEGSSAVDQSPITGESIPVQKNQGDEVYAGTINKEGYLEVEVTKKSGQSTVSKIVDLIRQAERKKAPIEKFVDKFARYYTPAVVGIALFTLISFPFILPGGFDEWFLKAITLLVIACPCALVISTPVTIVSAISSAARNGVLIKGGRYLEEMGKTKALALDKTGTLTEGKLKLTEVIAGKKFNEEEILKIAASLEKASEHHLARAIIEEAKKEDLTLKEVNEFSSLPGKGIKGKLDGQYFRVGKRELFPENELGEFRKLKEEGKTLIYVGTKEETLGALAFRDRLKPKTLETIARLKERGVELIMLTGDDKLTAKSVAEGAGITNYEAELLPEEKVEKIKDFSRSHGKVAMVGDGINDGPALAAADLGIAMGAAGTDIAMETADIALMADDLSALPYLFRISVQGERTIKQNIAASLLIKFGLGAAVFPGLVTLALAVLIGDMGATFLVTGNALSLSRISKS